METPMENLWKIYGKTEGKPVGNLMRENRWKKHGSFSRCFSMDSRA
jgi:hypothetical protein